jgi:hypothetical protein
MPSQKLLSFNLFSEFTRLLPRCWERDRGTLRPAHVLYAIMSMAVTSTHGYRQVLDYLKRTVGDQLGWVTAPFPSSFSDARRKLTPAQCKQAFTAIRGRVSLMTSVPKVRYGKYRLLAVDMTTLGLPPYADVCEAFSCATDSKGKTAKAPQATLTVTWDLSTNTPFDWRLEPCYSSERFAAYDMLSGLGLNDLLLADRGYPSRRMFHDIAQRGAAYLIRMPLGKAGGFREARAFALDTLQWDSEIGIHEDRKRTGEPTMQVRFIKHRLPNGEIAVFATNLLDKAEHPAQELCALYCHRWDLETAFREMKVWHGLENFNARFANGIHQEVSALMIFMLLTAELEHQARVHHAVAMAETAAGGTEEPEIRFNRRQIAECVGHLLVAAANGPASVDAEYTDCLAALWRFRQKRRPGRSFERIAKSPNSKWKRTTYNTSRKRRNLAE